MRIKISATGNWTDFSYDGAVSCRKLTSKCPYKKMTDTTSKLNHLNGYLPKSKETTQNALKLKNVTKNKLYPAYETPQGTIIQLNGLRTKLPSGETRQALTKFADETGLKSVLITGGAEAKGHSKGSFHGKNLAIDVAGSSFNKLSHEEARQAAHKAGFTHGLYEDFKGYKKDHWHFQIGAGNGLTDKHSLSNKTLTVKKY